MELPEDLLIRIVFLIACAAAFIQVMYYLLVFSRLGFHRPKLLSSEPQPLSIIIAARNERENLRQFLKEILEQNHPVFQVVVVNDCSWDGTDQVLEEYRDAYPHLKVITLHEQEKYRHGKKFALSLGIKGAVHEHLLFTDADCRPATASWASLMAAPLNEKKEIVIGYGAFRKEPGLLNCWARYDTAFNAMQYLSFALAGMPYMGTGRNLAYTRSLFFKNKGFAKHLHILSGDDDLFVNATITSSNAYVQLHPDAFTYSSAEKSFLSWCKQKRRHLSTSAHYQFRHRLILGLFFASHILFYAGLVALLVLKADSRLTAGVYAARMIIQVPVTGLAFSKLREPGLLIFTMLFDAMIALLYPILALFNRINKKHTWK